MCGGSRGPISFLNKVRGKVQKTSTANNWCKDGAVHGQATEARTSLMSGASVPVVAPRGGRRGVWDVGREERDGGNGIIISSKE